MSPRVLIFLFCLLLWPSAAPGLHAQAAAPASTPLILLRDGEALDYRVGWGVLGNAGELSIRAAEETADGATNLRVTTSSKTRGMVRMLYSFDGEAQMLFNPRDGHLLGATATTVAGKHRTQASILFDYDKAEASYVDVLRPERTTRVALPGDRPMDFITSVIQTRGWSLEPGQSHEVNVLFDDEFYDLTITVEREETISTPAGSRKAILLVPRMVGKSKGMFRRGGEIKIWVSADTKRLPLRFEVKLKVGTAFAELVRYTPPAAGL